MTSKIADFKSGPPSYTPGLFHDATLRGGEELGITSAGCRKAAFFQLGETKTEIELGTPVPSERKEASHT